MKAILIDPCNKTITEVKYDGNYKTIQKMIEYLYEYDNQIFCKLEFNFVLLKMPKLESQISNRGRLGLGQ